MNTRFEFPIDPFRAFLDPAATAPWRKTMFDQAERFWQGQSRLVEEYASFARAMLERRRMAADATMETVRKLGAASDSAEWARCYSDWLAGSWMRLADDGRDMVEEGLKVFAEMSQAVSAGASEAVEASTAAQQAAVRQATSAQATGLEQAASMAEAARGMKTPPRVRRPEEAPRPGAAE